MRKRIKGWLGVVLTYLSESDQLHTGHAEGSVLNVCVHADNLLPYEHRKLQSFKEFVDLFIFSLLLLEFIN